MDNSESLIVVDNTNARKWEAKPYVEYGVKKGYNIEFIETDTPWKFDVEVLSEKNVHSHIFQ